MKQSICYLYEYENYKQMKNVGFIKTTFHKDKVTFQIHGKGLDCDKFMDLEMFLFRSKADNYDVDRAGYVEGNQGAVNYIVSIDSMDTEQMSGYDGALLVSKNKKLYGATWKNKPICWEKIYARQEPMTQEPLQEVDPEMSVEPECHEKSEDRVEIECHEKSEDRVEIECHEEPQCRVEPECYKEPEYCQEFEHRVESEMEMKSGAVCELNLGGDSESVEKEQGQEIPSEYKKIDRHGISELPQREWKLANNNFLLHGFSNYNHLMLIRIQGRLYLGVPGVYHSREATVAKSFGFPYFQNVNIETLELEEVEYSTEENFGYWCRPVSERRGRVRGTYGEEYRRTT